ncbi:MAG: glycosyltransferase, partial [Paludibacteraceae bacterium]
PRKGFSYLFAALESLQTKLSEQQINNLMILTVGSQKPTAINSLKIKHHHIEYLHDKMAFAKTYNAADIYICPSVEDAGPMMINEAMMSGTPVIAFRMGVAEDLVIDGETGFIADTFDSKDLAARMLELVTMSSADRDIMAIKCRNFAMITCSQQIQIDKIVSLTKDLTTNYS